MHASRKARRPALPLLLLAGLPWLAALAACGDAEDKPAVPPRLLQRVSGNGQTGPAGEPLPEPVFVRVVDPQGVPVPGMPVSFAAAAGGGRPSALTAVTDGSGRASADWTLGPVPVSNGLLAQAVGQAVEFTARADPGAPPPLQLVYETPASFTSEGIAIHPERGVFLGTERGLLWSPGPTVAPQPLPLSGEEIEAPLGMAFGPGGDLFVCDSRAGGGDVKRVTPAGVCSTLSPGYDGRPFDLPNSLAVGPDGGLYLSATCEDRIYRISPETGAAEPFVSVTGPNGLAFSHDGAFLYVTTENPGIFCDGPWVPGGLCRVPVLPDGSAGEPEPLVADFAVAGDGLAFDREGNLYAIFSGITALEPPDLFTSVIYVFRPDGEFIPWVRVTVPRDIFSNLAFGAAPFDPRSLYAYGFTGRLYSVFTGIPGRPLP